PSRQGVPMVPKDLSIVFCRRQVVRRRNLRGGWFADFLFGGRNYQIEHHLFPAMPRASLRKVAPMIREYCADKKVVYTEVSIRESFATLRSEERRVGKECRARRRGAR